MAAEVERDPASLVIAASGRRGWWALWVVYLVWGSNFLAVDVVVRHIDPLAAAGIRFTAAGLLLYAFGSRRDRPPPRRADWAAAAKVGLVLFMGASGLLFWGFRYVSSAVGAVLIATVPFWMIGLDVAAGRMRLTVRPLAALTAGLAGVATITDPAAGGLEVQPVGVVLILAAAALWAVGSLQSRTLRVRVNMTTLTAMQMLTGGIGLSVLSAIGIATGLTDFGTVTPQAAWAMAWLIGPCAMVGFAAYTTALRTATPTAVAIYPYVNTVVAVALGWLILDEAFTAHLVLGAALILASLLTVTLRTTKPKDHSG